MLFFSMVSRQRWASVLTSAENASGVLDSARAPRSTNFSFKPGFARAATIAAFSVATTAGGVLAGATTPNQYSAAPKRGTTVEIGVAPGASGDGSSVETPSNRS